MSALLRKLGAEDRRTLVTLAARAGAVAPRHNLARPPNSFVGRDADMRAVATFLSEARLVTLVGPPGVGKTRLATELARTQVDVDANPDGVWMVELAGLAEPDLVAGRVLAALGGSSAGGRDPFEGLIDFAIPMSCLVVIDNCEHLLGGVSVVVDGLVSRTEGIRVLATSRRPLGVTGEVVVMVQPLSTPSPEQTIPETGHGPAVQLFCERAAAARPGFILSEATSEAVSALVWRLDGIPLALELAASRMRVFNPEELAAHLAAGADVLGAPATGPRHRTLNSAIDWSHRLLGPDDRVLFARLGVFAGSFSLGAAQAVCAGGKLDTGRVLELLPELVDHSLVAPVAGSTSHRYRMLDSIRAFAVTQWVDPDPDPVARRHACYFADLADEAESHLRG